MNKNLPKALTCIFQGLVTQPSGLFAFIANPITGNDSNRSNYDLQYWSPFKKFGSKNISF